MPSIGALYYPPAIAGGWIEVYFWCRVGLRICACVKIALRCSHQLGTTHLECRGNFQNQDQRGQVLPPLDLAHVRTLDSGQRSQFLLSNSLVQAKRDRTSTRLNSSP